MECAAALADDPRVAVTVFSGARDAGVNATTIWNLPRASRAAALFARLHGRNAYFSEQLTFFLAFLPHVLRERPDVIYFADLNLGNLCWHWRRVSGMQYRLLFYNGGLTTKPFTRADLVQQLTPTGIQEASERGENPDRQVMLPHGVRIPDALPARVTGHERAELGIPEGRQVVLSVGLLDKHIKRMDAVIRAVASLAEPRPFLVLLGAVTAETAELEELAGTLLGAHGYLMRTVDPDDVSRYYRAADVFILASRREGFGLAYVEALAHGLQIVAQDYSVPRFLLGDLALLDDLTDARRFEDVLSHALATPLSDDARAQRHESAKRRFSWSVLHEAYVQLLLRASQTPLVTA